MATVYRSVGGRKLTKVIALTREAQAEVDNRALFAAMAAEGYLNAAKRRTGTSRIDIEKGKVDSYVVLDDTRGLHAALSIEYGHAEYEVEDAHGNLIVVPAAAGLYPLHKAFPALGQRHRDVSSVQGGDNFRE